MNLVFNATDHAVNIHVEEDNYRTEGIELIIRNIPSLDKFWGVALNSFKPFIFIIL